MSNSPNSSSYQKGIDKLLEHRDIFEKLISEYLISVNSKYRSNMFPTTQITKIIMDKLNQPKTKFAVIHKIVRVILDNWKESGCTKFVQSTKKKKGVKFVYKFSEEDFKYLKGKYIISVMSEIENDIGSNETGNKFDVAMKTRASILDDEYFEIQDIINDIDFDE